MRCRTTLILAVILLAGLGLRALYLIELFDSPSFTVPAVDPGYHHYWARALATGDWTPPGDYADPQIRTSPYLRPPGYPHFLALIYSVFGPGYLAPRIVQMVLGLLNVCLGFLLARRWYGTPVGLVYAALLATYWIFIYFEGSFQEPVLLIFVLLLFIHVLARCAERLAFRYAFLAGLLLGVAGLIKPNPLLFLPVAVLWTWWLAYRRRAKARAYLIGLGIVPAVAIAIAPATIRNYVVARDFVLISSNFGVNLFVGNNEYADGLFLRYIPGFGSFYTCYEYPQLVARLERRLGRPLKHSEVSAHLARQGFHFMRENPARTARLMWRRALQFWTPDEISHNSVIDCDRDFSAVLSRIPGNFAFVLASSLLGLLRLALDHRSSRRRQTAPSPETGPRLEFTVLIAAFIFVFFLSYLPFFNAALYRVPVIPFLLILGAYGLTRIGQFAVTRDVPRTALWLAVGAGLYFLAAHPFVPYESPGPAEWRVARAKAWNEGRKPERAIAELRAALQIAPSQIGAHRLLAKLLRETGRNDEAAGHELRYRRLRRAKADPFVKVGSALARKGEREKAVLAFREAIRIDPAYARAHFKLASLLASAGQIDEAWRLARRAVRLSPDNPQMRCFLGDLLLDQARVQEAIGEYREVLRRHPDHQRAQERLERALQLRAESSGE